MPVDLSNVALPQLFDAKQKELLRRHVADGLIRVTFHPLSPLAIWNYTQRATFTLQEEWTSVMEMCRGLITHTVTGHVIARPFRKFWNAAPVATDNPGGLTWHVTEKLDGYLGIFWSLMGREEWQQREREWQQRDLYKTAGVLWGVASRGSFTSPHAQRATNWLRDWLVDLRRYNFYKFPDFFLHHTPLFECLFPEFRIVVPYQREEGLTVIAMVDNATGAEMLPVPGGIFGLNSVQRVNISLEDALKDDRPGHEGYVFLNARFDAGVPTVLRLKVKTAWYRQCHKLLYGLHERGVAEALRNGTLEAMLQHASILPEVRQKVQSCADAITKQVNDTEANVQEVMNLLRDEINSNSVPPEEFRKEYARRVTKNYTAPLTNALFLALDDMVKARSRTDYQPRLREFLLKVVAQNCDTTPLLSRDDDDADEA